MIISFWRYSHLGLAVSSFLLLIAASVTGILLSFEPIQQKTSGFKSNSVDTVTVATTIAAIKYNFTDIQSVSVNEYQFVTVHFTDSTGNNQSVFIDPATAKIIGTPQPQSSFFEWATNFHRSLFLKSTGRAIVGIVSFLLILSCISGIILIIKRQNGFRNFFKKIEKSSPAQYNHVFFGRIFLVFILAIAITGSYLSVYRFFLEEKKPSITIDETTIKDEPQLDITDFPIFKTTLLKDIQKIDFPFSDFPEDYFTLETGSAVNAVNQFTGDILVKNDFSTSYQLANFALKWHTGRVSIIWSVILLIASAYILYFIYSGFVITFNRSKGSIKNKFTADESTIIILVGSENGRTLLYAGSIFKQLIKLGFKVYLTDLNNYTVFPKADHILIFTGTYGEGEAPSNANKFLRLLNTVPQSQSVQYSVVGFGSRSYKNYCQYAYDVETTLKELHFTNELMPIKTIDEGSLEDFGIWVNEYAEIIHQALFVDEKQLLIKQQLQPFTVVKKTMLNSSNDFLVSFKTKNIKQFLSGDLLAIYPKNDHRERLYSIGIYDGLVNIVVKKHKYGMGSSFLYNLMEGDVFNARLVKNTHFHLPEKIKSILLISNGTGIGPFLGMINENKNADINLFCGFRHLDAFKIYEPIINSYLTQKKLSSVVVSYSRMNNKKYVYHLLQDDQENIWNKLSSGTVFMICGSINMYKDVIKVLDEICMVHHTSIEQFLEKEQIIHDCY